MQPESELNDIIFPIDHVEKITPELIDRLRVFDQDKVYFPSIKINSATLDWLEENTEHLGIAVEYCTKTDEFCNKFANSAFRAVYANVLSRSFQRVASKLEDSERFYGVVGDSFRVDVGHTIKTDAALIDFSQEEPIIALVVGVTQSLEGLFKTAKQILSKPHGKTEAVIIVKISEKYRGTETEPPWGLESPDDLAQKIRDGSLSEHIVQYQNDEMQPLVGWSTAHTYIWLKGRETPRQLSSGKEGLGQRGVAY